MRSVTFLTAGAVPEQCFGITAHRKRGKADGNETSEPNLEAGLQERQLGAALLS